MADYQSRAEMLDAFGPFSVLFEPIAGVQCPYMTLLGLLDDRAAKVMPFVRDATTKPHADSCILVLLRAVNWRPQLVGGVAAYFRPSNAATEQMWAALDSGSWVAPQLAAILSQCDCEFETAAISRLGNLCPPSEDPQYVIESPIERHSAQGPAGSYGRSAKSAASLLALLQADYPDSDATATLAANAELQKLISDDGDRSAEIAIQWRATFLELAADR